MDARRISWQNGHFFPGLANMGMNAIDTEKSTDSVDDGPKVASGSDQALGSVPAAQSPSRSVLPGLALIVSILALAAAAWTGWQLLALQGVPSQVIGDAGKIQDLSRRLDGLTEQTDRQRQLVDDLETSLESGLGVIPELSLRLEQNEKQLANVPGINARGRSNWFKTEALYYLKIANAQASLTGNAQVAASALKLADDNLRDAGDPALNPVRAQLSEELTALKAMPVVDRTGISLRLQSLAAQAGDWPFNSAAPNNFSPDIAGAPAEAEATDYWGRFKATVKAVFASIVSVKETDASHVAQLSNVEEAMITETMKAELQLARLALIGGNDELFRQSLMRVNEQVNEYFDVSTSAVVAAQEAIIELLALELPGPLPDISGSLTLMRTLNDSPQDSAGGEGL